MRHHSFLETLTIWTKPFSIWPKPSAQWTILENWVTQQFVPIHILQNKERKMDETSAIPGKLVINDENVRENFIRVFSTPPPPPLAAKKPYSYPKLPCFHPPQTTPKRHLFNSIPMYLFVSPRFLHIISLSQTKDNPPNNSRDIIFHEL